MQIFHFRTPCSQMNESHRVCQLDGTRSRLGPTEVGGRGSPLGPTLSRPEGQKRASTFFLCGCARFSILLGIASGNPEINLRK